MRSSREHDLQVAIFTWAAFYERDYPGLRWMFAIPNAGKRSGRAGRWLRDEGMRAGVSDICLPFPAGGYHGLFAEVKVKPNGLTGPQAAFLAAMNRRGYLVDVWYSFDQAVRVLSAYLAGGGRPGEKIGGG